jgi:hypothetical protein
VAGIGVWLARPSAVVVRLAAVSRLSALPAAERQLGTAVERLRGDRSTAPRALVACAVAAVVVGLGLAPLAPAAGYAAFVAPRIAADRRAAAIRGDSERALVVAVEWADALASAGRPAESAFAAIASRGTGATLLDAVLREASAAASLGAPLFRSLAAEATAAGLGRLAAIADDLDRSRDLGHGSRSVVRDARDELRREERARAIAAASAVDARLMVVLVCCYLPALMLVVVVPLFVGLLGGLAE